jgi:hydroxymethylglutaryl-CoA lyase
MRDVEIVEVGPRDGLQNEARPIPTAAKIALIDTLSRAGFSRIEAASFVSPKWVPQMADGAAVLAGIARATGVRYAALTPNMKGYEAARAAGADAVAIFGSASEGFSRANINASIAESLDRFRPLAERARADGVPLRGYVSCVTDCPYDGPVAPAAVARVAAALAAMGCHEISLGDTIGRGTPDRVGAMLDAVLAEVPAGRLAGHFHDTGGLALANVAVALDRGVRVFDAAVGGLGGCPYAPGAAGNVATEALAAFLTARGLSHGLDTAVLAQAAAMARAMRAGGAGSLQGTGADRLNDPGRSP